MTDPRNPISERTLRQLEEAKQHAIRRGELFESWRTAARAKVGQTCLAYERLGTSDENLAMLEQSLGEAFLAGMKAANHAT